ncbi:hypothetical protein B7463_g957, partial [Scytalidium lignicola]
MPPKAAAARSKRRASVDTASTAAKSTTTKSGRASSTTNTSADETKPAPSAGTKRKAADTEVEPKGKKAKTEVAPPAAKKAAAPKKAAPKKAVPKAAPKKAAAPKKTTTAKKPVAKKVVEKKVEAEEEEEQEEEAAPAEITEPEKEIPKPKPAPKKAAPKKAAPKKVVPDINPPPTKILDIYVFGEGTAGELGLGAVKYDGKKPIDVKRPRINEKLSASKVGVVQIAVGGMHCAALTHDNKILTWGVNDQGALGRETPNLGKMKEVNPDKDDDSDSDSDDDDDTGLNPLEAEPHEVDPKHFPEGTRFAHLAASDSATFAVTTDGLVYGWGTFRGNDGILGFRQGIRSQTTPMLIPELKNIVTLATGTNHVLAVNNKGKVFGWGAGEQNQLARRVVSRTATGALVPREFGLQRKVIKAVGCGDYHSFAIDNNNNVYAWGLNTFGQTGITKDDEDENTVAVPTLVKNLKEYSIKDISGGAHHTLSCTEDGKVLVWGRIDNAQGGMSIDKFNKDDLFLDEHGKPRYLLKPAIIGDIKDAGVQVSAATDSCLVVCANGKAYSWGFSGNYQTGQGTTDDIVEATLIENSAIKGKKLVFAGAGGQFSVLAGEHEDTPMVNGV